MQKRQHLPYPIGKKVVDSSETERKERMDTSSLMEQILSRDNLNAAYLQVVRRRVEIPKPDGGVRNLGVPTVTDRFIQQAIAQVLTPIYEEQFRPSGLKYLGFGFCFDTRAHQFKAKPHAKSVVKFKRRMKVLTCRRD